MLTRARGHDSPALDSSTLPDARCQKASVSPRSSGMRVTKCIRGTDLGGLVTSIFKVLPLIISIRPTEHEISGAEGRVLLFYGQLS